MSNNKRKVPASDDDEKDSKRKAPASDDDEKDSNKTKALVGTASDGTDAVRYRECSVMFNEAVYDGTFSGDIVDGREDAERWASGRGTFIFAGDTSPEGEDGFRLTATRFNAYDNNGEVCGIGRLVRADGTLKYIGGFMGGWYEGRGIEFEKDGVTPSEGGDGCWEYATHGFINCFRLKPGAPAPRSIPEAGEPGHDDMHLDDDDDAQNVVDWIDRS